MTEAATDIIVVGCKEASISSMENELAFDLTVIGGDVEIPSWP
jgi:hypothetical protein